MKNTEEVKKSQRGTSKEKFNTNYKLRNLFSSSMAFLNSILDLALIIVCSV